MDIIDAAEYVAHQGNLFVAVAADHLVIICVCDDFVNHSKQRQSQLVCVSCDYLAVTIVSVASLLVSSL